MGKKRRIKERAFKVWEIPHTCPICSAKMDCMSSVMGAGDKPAEGTFTICFNCAEIAVLDKDLQPHRPAPEVLFKLMLHTQWRKVQMTQALIKRGPGFGRFTAADVGV